MAPIETETAAPKQFPNKLSLFDSHRQFLVRRRWQSVDPKYMSDVERGLAKKLPFVNKEIHCSICLCDVSGKANSVVEVQRCGHKFCADDMREWLKEGDSCPYCRQKIYDTYNCTACTAEGRYFSTVSRNKLHNHQSARHGSHYCGECRSLFKDADDLHLHHASQHGHRYCSQHRVVAETQNRILAYYTLHHGYTYCYKCRKLFENEKGASDHYKIVQHFRKHCSKCKGLFLWEQDLQDHYSNGHRPLEQKSIGSDHKN